MLMASNRKHRSRRRVAALNFLSNISLDGTHRDTKCVIFQKRGLFNDDFSRSEESSCDGRKNDEFLLEKCSSPTAPAKPASLDEVDGVRLHPAANLSQTPYKLISSTEVFDDGGSTCEEVTEEKSGFGSSKRYRFNRCDTSPCLSSSFGGDPLANSYSSGERPPVRKRRLFHTLSISEDSSTHTNEQSEVLDILQTLSVQGTRTRQKSTSSSTSSLGSAPKPVVRIVPPNRNKTVHFAKERVVLLSSRKSPFAVYSTLPYRKLGSQSAVLQADLDTLLHQSSGSQLPGVTKEEALLHLGLRAVEQVEDGQDISYSQLLVPTRLSAVTLSIPKDGVHLAVPETAPPPLPGGGSHPPIPFRSWSHDPSLQAHTGPVYTETEITGTELMYNPDLLDDPELRSGKHRTLITFPSYMTSVIDYVRPSELKKELNEQFKEKFPQIQLTLSKLRSLKRDMKKIARKCNLDIWTVSQSYVFLEKIILKGLINKPNRKLCAAVCLLLSAKLNDIKGSDISGIIEVMEDTFKLNTKDLLAFEFAILVALEFGLHTPDSDIYPHYQRLLYSS